MTEKTTGLGQYHSQVQELLQTPNIYDKQPSSMSDAPTSQDVFSKNQRKYRQQLRKRAIISLEQKKAICSYHLAHPKARHFEINDALGIDVERTTILKILKEKDKWLDLDSRGSAGKKAVRRVARFSKVNRAVALWLQICHPGYLRRLFIWGSGTSIHNNGLRSSTADEECEDEQDFNMELPSAKDIQAQARIFAAMFPDETAFKASTGWLSSFRLNLSLAQFPAIASTLELISDTEPPLYRYIEQETDPRLKPEPTMLSRYIYNQNQQHPSTKWYKSKASNAGPYSRRINLNTPTGLKERVWREPGRDEQPAGHVLEQ
ncbi:hypothetical protein BGZ93_005967 [Podila epicladia]|nr:hypothetical protein BGZ92_008616 [Podila epicladia]KAG0095366.1 hypothetical protein BGZ93_005967 [Podila epicladia]